MAKKLPELTIIKDTREQDGWDFQAEEKRSGKCQIVSCVDKKLDTGDYSIEGLENLFTIERKNGFSELFGNLGSKVSRERFEREMERMSEIPHSYILVETVLSKDTLTLGIPQSSSRMPSSSILEYLIRYNMKYNVQFMFVGDCGKKVARRIVEEVARTYLW